MKKIFGALLALVLVSVGSQAITVTEAFAKIEKMDGVALSEMPQYDVAKEGLDVGKVAMLLGQPAGVLDGIEAEITDPLVVSQKIQGQDTNIYASEPVDGVTTALSITKTPVGPVVLFVQGKGDVIAHLKE